jgi:hypothetical protein
MQRITDLIPTPRRCPAAGRDYEVWPGTLEDVARLQAWLDGLWIDPIDDFMKVMLSDADDSARQAASRKAMEDLGPPLWDDERGADRLATVAGVAVFLASALRRGHPNLKAPDVVEIVTGSEDRPAMTSEEYARIRRVFFGVDSRREIERLMIGPLPERGGRRLTWGEVVDEISRERNWTYPQVYALTFAEVGNVRRHGKPPEEIEIPVEDGQDPAEVWRDVCVRVYGKPPEEMFPE